MARFPPNRLVADSLLFQLLWVTVLIPGKHRASATFSLQQVSLRNSSCSSLRPAM